MEILVLEALLVQLDPKVLEDLTDLKGKLGEL